MSNKAAVGVLFGQYNKFYAYIEVSGTRYLRNDLTVHSYMNHDGGTYFDTRDEAQDLADKYNAAHATPKKWRDMTRAEKGALLLDVHNGKQLRVYSSLFGWLEYAGEINDNLAYGIAPEPVRETVALCYRKDVAHVKNKIGTINLIDGVPDCTSIRMGSTS
jgi:hypothetical protein